jgi:hypothetical protein
LGTSNLKIWLFYKSVLIKKRNHVGS